MSSDLVPATSQVSDVLATMLCQKIEAAAEKVTLSMSAARVPQRHEAVGAVLESIGEQKQGLAERMKSASPIMKRILSALLRALEDQEERILATTIPRSCPRKGEG